MIKELTASIGLLRILTFLEGVSLVILVFVAMPLKYLFADPSLVKILGPIHGGLFLLFVFSAIRVSTDQNWKFRETTWLLMVASFIPFGNFYIDKKVLRKIENQE